MGEAETRLGRARELAQLTDARLSVAEIARDLGRLYAQTGRPVLARRALRESVDAFGDLGATGKARRPASSWRRSARLPDAR